MGAAIAGGGAVESGGVGDAHGDAGGVGPDVGVSVGDGVAVAGGAGGAAFSSISGKLARALGSGSTARAEYVVPSAAIVKSAARFNLCMSVTRNTLHDLHRAFVRVDGPIGVAFVRGHERAK